MQNDLGYGENKTQGTGVPEVIFGNKNKIVHFTFVYKDKDQLLKEAEQKIEELTRLLAEKPAVKPSFFQRMLDATSQWLLGFITPDSDSDDFNSDSNSDDFYSGLQIYVSVGSHFVGFVLKFRNPNMFTPIRNTRYA